MRNYRIYLYITLSFALFFFLISLFATPYFIRNTIINLLDSEIISAKMETRQVATIAGEIIINKEDKTKVLASIQKAITNTEQENIYLSVIDWSGKVVSYPDQTQIGSKSADQTIGETTMETTISASELYNYIKSIDKEASLNVGENIIYMTPIPNSDLIIGAHINVKNIQQRIEERSTLFNTGFVIVGLLTLLFVLAVIRFVSSYYEEQLAVKNSKIEDSVLNLSKLNASLEKYQSNLQEIKANQERRTKDVEIEPTEIQETSKKRLLTYVRNELLSIPAEDIAYIYVDNTITYVIRKDGKRSTTNDSLDQIYNSLDSKLFFRANRQIIVGIHAIEKITKFGNSALKIQTNPEPEVEIVIGKNKAASFKQWLDL